MTNKEKQNAQAHILYACGLITEDQMTRIVNARFSYDLVETMIDIQRGIIAPEIGRTFLVRMTK